MKENKKVVEWEKGGNAKEDITIRRRIKRETSGKKQEKGKQKRRQKNKKGNVTLTGRKRTEETLRQ